MLLTFLDDVGGREKQLGLVNQEAPTLISSWYC